MKERLEYLFWQYLRGTASLPELEEFLSVVHDARNDQTLRRLIREVYQDIHQKDPEITFYIDEGGNLRLDGGEETSEQAGEMIVAQPLKKKWASFQWLSLPAYGLILLVLLGGMIWGLSGPAKKQVSRHKEIAAVQSLTRKFTERSEYKFLLLPDSTQVWLNANSSLEFPDEFSDGRREVYLTGEAYFDVKHAEDLPFIIHTGKITTTVLGTAFNIKAYPYQQEVQVSVSKGKVKVSRGDRTIAVLQKGQQLKVSHSDTVFRQKNVDVEKIAYWQQGTLSYDDEMLGDILKDLEHIYNVSIWMNDPVLLTERMTTSFNRNIGIDQALKIICRLIDKQLVEADGRYTIQ